jgi:hypothetical protein
MGRRKDGDPTPHETVEYVLSNGTREKRVIRRFFRGKAQCPQGFQQYLGSNMIWPPEFVSWWLDYIDSYQARECERKNPGFLVKEVNMLTVDD